MQHPQRGDITDRQAEADRFGRERQLFGEHRDGRVERPSSLEESGGENQARAMGRIDISLPAARAGIVAP